MIVQKTTALDRAKACLDRSGAFSASAAVEQIKALHDEIERLRAENDEKQTVIDGLQSIINRAKVNGGNINA